jgi:hypothetical protein
MKPNREEASTILYLETCAVDHGGMVDARRMNADDFATVIRLGEAGMLRFGRMLSAAIKDIGPHYRCSHWVEFTQAGYTLAATLRQQRAERNLMNKEWRTEGKAP